MTSKSCNIACLEDSGNGIVSKEEFSNIMNSLFCTIGEELASKFDATPNPFLSGDYGDTNNIAGFRSRTIEVRKSGMHLPRLKLQSFGNENISCYFLKLALPLIENSLVCLFNISLVASQFPDSWKLARVTPIFKEGGKTENSNYHPISVLPVISRLFERLVASQLYQHINDNGYPSSEQPGFLRLYSTDTCLLKTLMTGTMDWILGS